ncbi:MAG: TonB-dependent receptor, partial [Bdellovibrio sp.]
MTVDILSTVRKAQSINLDKTRYGTFAEIGAGQEVARHFFQAGHASQTVAKTMSAYDKTFSDEIYGKGSRFVSQERLMKMLEHEYALLEARLSAQRGADTCFFAFAN